MYKLSFKQFLKEDHEKVMNKKQMINYINTLWAKTTSTNKQEFMSAIRKYSKSDSDCSMNACAEKICNYDQKECDKVIHSLEKIVNYRKDIKL